MGDVGGAPLPQEDALPAEGAEGGAQLTDCETDGAAEADAEMDAPEPSGLPPKGRMPCRPWPRRSDRYYGYGGRGRSAW